MFKVNRKHLTHLFVVIAAVLLLSLLIPSLRHPAVNILKYPLSLSTFIRREVGALIFYHRNFTENEKLRKQVDFLRARVNDKDEAFLENKRLKNLLDFKQKSKQKVVACRVIGHSVDSWSSIVFIDKGTYHGVRKGMVAVTYLGLAGRVVEAFKTASKVMLVNDPNFSVSALVQRSRQEGLVCGTLGSNLIMKYLPKESDIQVTDKIITSGLTWLYPKGLLIGIVIDVGDEFSGLSRYAVIKPAINPANIEELFIIIPDKN